MKDDGGKRLVTKAQRHEDLLVEEAMVGGDGCWLVV